MRLILTIVILMYLNVASGQIHVPGMPLEVSNTMASQQEAWNRGDIPAFMNGYWDSDSLIFIGKSGTNTGYQTTLDNYLKSYPTKESMGTLKFKNRSWLPLSETTALVIGRWQISDDVKGMYSLIWRKINGKWVIVADHSS